MCSCTSTSGAHCANPQSGVTLCDHHSTRGPRSPPCLPQRAASSWAQRGLDSSLKRATARSKSDPVGRMVCSFADLGSDATATGLNVSAPRDSLSLASACVTRWLTRERRNNLLLLLLLLLLLFCLAREEGPLSRSPTSFKPPTSSTPNPLNYSNTPHCYTLAPPPPRVQGRHRGAGRHPHQGQGKAFRGLCSPRCSAQRSPHSTTGCSTSSASETLGARCSSAGAAFPRRQVCRRRQRLSLSSCSHTVLYAVHFGTQSL